MAKQQKLPKELNRRQLARREKEKRLNRILIGSAIGVVALIVLVLGYGLLMELVIKPGKPVAKVDGVAITTKEFQSRLYYERLLMRNQLQAYQNYLLQIDPNDEAMQSLSQQIQTTISNLETQLSETMASAVAKQVLDSMVEERLVQKEAQARGLTVSQDEVNLSIEQMLGYDRTITATETTTATATPQESFDSLYQKFREDILGESKLSEEAYRTMVETNLLKEQLKAVLGADIEQTADQVEVTFFMLKSEEDGRALQERINNGEDVKALVEELNNDDSTDTAAYDFPWLPAGYIGGQLGPTLEQVAFNTPIGKAAEPTLGSDGRYYVIYVSGHEERPLSESLLAQNREQNYTAWLSEQKTQRCEYLDWQKAVLTTP
ncbi:MAG TPA: SurA N-terminal domain-containing protein [Anaerolineae bacterium]|nr:SurA N-terminal domain-containing protein [Anaerolineae bacterium]HQK14369.1 SurA N-terminal domain-containing protein [Anaerolineae bacterium]